jgi:hypothetical protein
MSPEWSLPDVASEYVSSVVEKHSVDASAARSALGLFPLLQEWAAPCSAEIMLSGSHARGTAIGLAADADIFLSLPESAGPSIKDIYWRLFHWLDHKGLRSKAGDVSIRVKQDGITMDIVPGRTRTARTYELSRSRALGTRVCLPSPHTLYSRKNDTWVQTNVFDHVRLVRDSGRASEIRALKIWRERNRLQFSSLYLELTVIHSLKSRYSHAKHSPSPATGLAGNFRRVLHYLAADFIHARVTDPANVNNVISDHQRPEEKRVIAQTARMALARLDPRPKKKTASKDPGKENWLPEAATLQKWQSVLW